MNKTVSWTRNGRDEKRYEPIKIMPCALLAMNSYSINSWPIFSSQNCDKTRNVIVSTGLCLCLSKIEAMSRKFQFVIFHGILFGTWIITSREIKNSILESLWLPRLFSTSRFTGTKTPLSLFKHAVVENHYSPYALLKGTSVPNRMNAF